LPAIAGSRGFSGTQRGGYRLILIRTRFQIPIATALNLSNHPFWGYPHQRKKPLLPAIFPNFCQPDLQVAGAAELQRDLAGWKSSDYPVIIQDQL